MWLRPTAKVELLPLLFTAANPTEVGEYCTEFRLNRAFATKPSHLSVLSLPSTGVADIVAVEVPPRMILREAELPAAPAPCIAGRLDGCAGG